MNYKETYRRYYDYTKDENILCEVCNAVAVDIHHIIYKSRGGSDLIENLVSLCRSCHNKAHNEQLTAKQLQDIHDLNM